MKKIVTFLVVLVASSTTLIKPYTGWFTDENGNLLETNNTNSNTVKGFQISIDSCDELNGGQNCFWGSMFSGRDWPWNYRQLVKTIWINVTGAGGCSICICRPQLQSHFPNANLDNTQMNFPDANPPGSFTISNPGDDYVGYATWSSNC